MPFVRTMSMEQRWQDLANLLSLPGPGDASAMSHPFAHHHHHHHHNYSGGPSSAYTPDNTRGVLLHNATLAPPIGDLNNTGPYPNMSEYPSAAIVHHFFPVEGVDFIFT
jgi:hypothetical protein